MNNLFRRCVVMMAVSGSLLSAHAQNVGIGTTSPATRLHIYSETSTYLTIDNGTSSSKSGINLSSSGTTRASILYDPSTSWGTNGGLILNGSTGSTPNTIINPSAGNVGIGTAIPPNILTISNGGTTAGSVTSYPLAVQMSGSTDLTIGSDAGSAYIQSWNSKPLVINSQGNAINFSNSGTTITAANLAGTGTRIVYANSSGQLITQPVPVSNGTMIFDYTGANQYFVVPTGVSTLKVQLWGAGGAGGYNGSSGSGGGGGFVSGTLSVSSGQLLTIIVGGAGCQSCTNNAFGGGGAGSTSGQGGAGGGRSAILSNGVELVTAGGGGGGSRESTNAYGGGGGGGGTTGSNSPPSENYGNGASGFAHHGYYGGGAGTCVAGNGTAGTSYLGGAGGCCDGNSGGYDYSGGGGGGGYIGGGGGAKVQSSCSNQSGGAGGSSYIGGLATCTNNLQGTQGTGNGTTYYAANNAGLPSGYVNARGYGGGYGSSGGNGLITLSW